jgi:TPR repeat protein
MQLVFRPEPPSVVTMDQPLFRRLFKHSSTPPLETTETQAEHGSAEAQFHLGLKCANGNGRAQDYGQAVKWYLKAAGQNHPLAQFNLGIMYASGQGVSRNSTEAEVWFGRSARQGDAGAQHHLGLSHYRASIQGLPQDIPESRIEAYKWLGLAAAQGYRGSDAVRNTLVLKMSHEDVAEATQRADRFTLALGDNSTNQ